MSPPAAAPNAADFAARRRAQPGADGKTGTSRWLLVAIVLLAVALRVVAWAGAPLMAGDGADSLWQAQRFLAGDLTAALSHPFPPLYAMTIAAVGRLTDDLALAAVLVSMLTGVLIVLAVHGLARLALPDRRDVACGSALLAALYPPGLLATADVTSDGLFLALFLFAMLLLFSAEQTRKLRLRLFGVGLLLGLAWLARTERLFLLLPVAFWLVAGLTRRESRRHRPLPPRGLYLAGAALCLLGLLLFVAPYSVLVHDETGGWGAAVTDASGLWPTGTLPAPADSPLGSPRVGVDEEGETAPSSWLPSEAERVVLALGGHVPARPTTDGFAAKRSDDGQHAAPAGALEVRDGAPEAAPPRRVPPPIQNLIHGCQLYFAAYTQAAATLGHTVRIEVLLLAALGLPVLLRRRIALLSMFVLLLAGWLALVAARITLGGALGPRDLLGPALLVLPVAGAGVAWLWGAARYYPDRPAVLRLLGRLPVLLLVVALIGLTVASSLTPPAGAAARVEALAWAREHSDPIERIAVIDRRDAWYAQRLILSVGLPADETAVLEEMKRLDVRLLVQRLAALQQHAPDWLAGGPFSELTRFGDGPDAVVVLERMPG